MSASGGSVAAWIPLAVGVVLVYRAILAGLLQAFHALPSLQRRTLLEGEAIPDPRLVRLLARPHTFGLGITLLSQALLVLLLGLLWSFRLVLPGGVGTLLGLTLAYLWVMDLALPSLLVGADPATWLLRFFRAYAPFHRLVAPLVAPLGHYVDRQRERLERSREEDEPPSEEAVTAFLQEGEAEGILEAEDRELIRNVVDFGDTVVREVMTPRTSIEAVDVGAGREEVWAAFRASRHSRLPVFAGTVDQIVGVLLLKDLLQLGPDEPLDLRALAKPPLFVPESRAVKDLVGDLQRTRNQMAIVVDEFGSVSGLVTLEDLLEELFGEIQDEHEGRPDIQEVGATQLLVAGQVHVEDLAARLGVVWEREGYDTVAGLLMARLGRVPKEGETARVEGARLTVLQMEGAKVVLVRVEREPDGGA